MSANVGNTSAQASSKPQQATKNNPSSQPHRPQYVSRSFFSSTVHNAGQPVVHVSRSSFADGSGKKKLMQERRIGNKRAVSTWEESVGEHANQDAITNANRKTTYEATEAAEFEAAWKNLHQEHHALKNGSHDHQSATSNAEETTSHHQLGDGQLPISNSKAIETAGAKGAATPKVVFSDTESKPETETEQLPVLKSSHGRPKTAPAGNQPSDAVTNQSQTPQDDGQQFRHHDAHWDGWMGPPSLAHFSTAFDDFDHAFSRRVPWWAGTPGMGRVRRRWHPSQAFMAPGYAFDPWSFHPLAF